MNVLTQNQNNYSLYGSHCVVGLISTPIGFLLFYVGAEWANKRECSGSGSEGNNQAVQTAIYPGYSPYLKLEIQNLVKKLVSCIVYDLLQAEDNPVKKREDKPRDLLKRNDKKQREKIEKTFIPILPPNCKESGKKKDLVEKKLMNDLRSQGTKGNDELVNGLRENFKETLKRHYEEEQKEQGSSYEKSKEPKELIESVLEIKLKGVYNKNLRLGAEVIGQLKNFFCDEEGLPQLNPEEQSLLEKLVPNQELSKRYKWNGGLEVVLKILDNSQNISTNFLWEVVSHKLVDDAICIVNCHGISQDPKTKNYIIVMDYIYGGSLKNPRSIGKSMEDFASNHVLNFTGKFRQLLSVLNGLNHIHQKGLIHRDLHPGNILNMDIMYLITDLGQCRPANEENDEKNYGVLPYVAPEVLCGKPHTQDSDIYSFGIIAYEILTGLPPYTVYDKEKNYPDPDKRPTSRALERILVREYYRDIMHEKDTKFYLQYKRVEEEYNKKIINNIRVEHNLFNSRVSCSLDFKNLPKEPQISKEIDERHASINFPETVNATTRNKRKSVIFSESPIEKKSVRLERRKDSKVNSQKPKNQQISLEIDVSKQTG
ncbi:2819_t:CDS:2 [Gigaspora margarita]|uniref:2819_t:CDS:1 n=1 Tax=Gigaspora margarita TaxID=4874 RepID=A0ABM8W4Y9_GIGMA|nr:2819_t:CDS:2 [Gigaspora margarita]